MTRIETSRVNEVIGLQIANVQEAAHKISSDGELETIETEIGALEQAVAELKGSLAALPHRQK